MPREKSLKEEKKEEFESKLIDLARVARVVAGGRRFSFRATMVAGNRTGQVGMGIAKGADVTLAVGKATKQAKKNLIEVPITETGTIPHQTEAKYGASQVLLKPSFGGKGIVAGGVVRAICDLAGIRHISSKIISRSGNKINNARATIAALQELKPHKTDAKLKENRKTDAKV